MASRHGIRLIGRIITGAFCCWVIAAVLTFSSLPLGDSPSDSFLPDYLLDVAVFVAGLPFAIPGVEPFLLVVVYPILVTAAAGMAFVSDGQASTGRT